MASPPKCLSPVQNQGAVHQLLRLANQVASVCGTKSQPGRQGNQLMVLAMEGPEFPEVPEAKKKDRDDGENALKPFIFLGTYMSE